MQVDTLTGDLTGTLHVYNRTTLDATSTGPFINTSLLVYSLGLAYMPQNVILADGMSIIARGNIMDWYNITILDRAVLSLDSGTYYLLNFVIGPGAKAILVHPHFVFIILIFI